MSRRTHAADPATDGRELVEQLGGRWTPRGGMCRCPAHDDRNPSLSVRLGRSRLLFHCFAGCDAASIFAALKRLGLTAPAAASAAPGGEKCDDALSAAALRLWGAARPIANTPADRYLAARALRTRSPELRHHWRTPLGAKPFTRFGPALIAAVRDESSIVAVHRTFLENPSGSVPAAAGAKLALGPLGRGAVRLGGVALRLGLAEGIETALSASALFGLPCWATLGTERFRHVVLPPEVGELSLFLDADAGGRRAEALAREAFAHLASVEAHYPTRPGLDWNDVLRARRRGAPL